MRVGFICNEFPPPPAGGIGTFTSELAHGLAGLGHRAVIAGLYRGSGADSVEHPAAGITLHRLVAGHGLTDGFAARARLFRFIRELSRKREIDLVEVPDFEGLCAGWGELPIPIVVRLHGSVTYFATEMHARVPPFMKRIERRALSRADAVFAVSRYVAERTAQIFHLDALPSVIHNSVPMPSADHAKRDYRSQGIVAYSGTLAQKKGVFSLARAWPRVRSSVPNARLLMIGRDSLPGLPVASEEIRHLAGEHADAISFTGHLPKPEMEKLLIGADVGVYPSYSEAFALAPMESMALGIPTICSSRASGPELIRDGIDGVLCDPDDIDGIAIRIVTLLKDEAARRRFGEAGRERIANAFSYGAALDKNVALYRQCLNRGSTGGGA